MVAACSLKANELQFSSLTLERESSARLTLTFAPSPEPVAAFQFDLDYDPSALQLTPIVGGAMRLAGKTLTTAPLNSRQTRFLVTGWNQNAILEGAVIEFLVGIAPNAEIQKYPLHLSNLLATFPNGQAAPVTAVDGAVTVISGTAKRLSEAGVLNGASFISGPLAPGEIATLLGQSIGPLLGTVPESGASSPILGGTSVWFDGVQAPLLYAGPNQINVVVPFEVSGDRTELLVRRGGVVAANLTVALAASAPAIFALNASGVGPAAVLNQDGSINSATNPARAGEVVSFFATGAGTMDPPATDGTLGRDIKQRPVLPVSTKIGGEEAEVLYAGPAPGLIEGVLQVNCRVPSDLPAGLAVEVTLLVGGVPSPVGPTLSIRLADSVQTAF
ncbi:MAG: hypothetical protein ABIR70_14410 [Bryobacteraceae bacterium]